MMMAYVVQLDTGLLSNLVMSARLDQIDIQVSNVYFLIRMSRQPPLT
jgi:hypothetical protein